MMLKPGSLVKSSLNDVGPSSDAPSEAESLSAMAGVFDHFVTCEST